MKRSLELLGIEGSGLVLDNLRYNNKKTDEELLSEIKKIYNEAEEEKYLRSVIDKKRAGLVKSKRYLANLVKKSDPLFACELVMSACRSSPVDPDNYLLFGEIAIEHKAWAVAKTSFEVVKWLCLDEHTDTLKKVKELLDQVSLSIQKGDIDNSKDKLWYNKSPDKFWILQRLFYQAMFDKLSYYAFRLVDVFGDDKSNYEVVYKALSLIDDNNYMHSFINYVKEHLSTDEINLNLFLGMAYYRLFDFESSIKYLKESLALSKLNPKVLFYLALNHLMKVNLKEFVQTCEKIVPISDPAFVALYFIYTTIINFAMGKKVFPDQKNISREIAIIIKKLLLCKQNETVESLLKQFKKLDLYFILPYLALYLAEVFINNNLLGIAKNVLENTSDSEVHRLYSWIYRLEGNNELAEKELSEYRRTWAPEKDEGVFCRLENLNLPKSSPDNLQEIFNSLKDAYEQTKELIHQIEIEYGLNEFTCVETTCQDCCKKTFPCISYTEYMYMAQWLDKQSEEVRKQIQEESSRIVSSYKEKYKKEPPFLYGNVFDQQKEYPLEFMFDCPFLGDNKCNVYEARPFTCRAYGYASLDGVKFKGCNYFYNQFKAATKLTDVRKVVSMKSFFDFAKLTDEKLIGRRIMAPIPVWFAQNHAETITKVKQAINNQELLVKKKV